ncbi:nickel-dependent lactate racemase [Candidatus Hydrogenedentota bacterium]
MKVSFPYGKGKLSLSLPDESICYETSFPPVQDSSEETVRRVLQDPIDSPALDEAIRHRRSGDIVIVVSDITRPIPYRQFLPKMLATIEGAGVAREEIVILIATGMHRPSTDAERTMMFGSHVAQNYRIVDHVADDSTNLVELSKKSWFGNTVHLNRLFMEAGFRLVTGLVEPHFMAGFSGGRKAVCPGLSSLETIRRFHGYEFLADEKACNGRLAGNPCHEESMSVARLAEADFSLNVVVNKEREVVKAFAGELESAHIAACDFVHECASPEVAQEVDVVITSCGGYPLDGTFYQCVKAMVSCLPTVKSGGKIIAFGSCSEGIGSTEYSRIMEEYAGRWRDFITDISRQDSFVKDQWELQMQCRALAKVGQENLMFVSDGFSKDGMGTLSTNGIVAAPGAVAEELQKVLDDECSNGASIAVIPEGPYCAPMKAM